MMNNSRKIVHLTWKIRSTTCANCLQKQRLSTIAKSKKSVNLAFMTYERHADNTPQLQPLITLHGLMGSKTNWQSMAKVFGKSGRMVVAVDARNHGESVHTEDMDYFLMRDDLLRLMDELEIDQAVLLGHSMGGKVAMTTALTKPERVSGLIVEDVAPMPSPSANKVPAYLEAMLKLSLDLRDTSMDVPMSRVRKFILQVLSEVVEEASIQHFLASNLVVKDNKYQWRVNIDSLINNFPTIAGFPEFEHEQYYGSTLFVGGSESDYLQNSNLPKILSLFPDADIQHIEGAGHWVHSDKPYDFIQVVEDFLDESGL